MAFIYIFINLLDNVDFRNFFLFYVQGQGQMD